MKSVLCAAAIGLASAAEMCNSLARDTLGRHQMCNDGTECSPAILDCSMGLDKCMCGTRARLMAPMGVEFCDSLARDALGRHQICNDGTECSPAILDCSMGLDKCMCGTRSNLPAIEITTEIDIPAGTELCDATASPKQMCSNGMPCDANLLQCLSEKLCICGTADRGLMPETASLRAARQYLRRGQHSLSRTIPVGDAGVQSLGVDTVIREVRQPLTLDHAPHTHVPADKRGKLVQTPQGTIFHPHGQPTNTILPLAQMQQYYGEAARAPLMQTTPHAYTTAGRMAASQPRRITNAQIAARYGNIMGRVVN